MPRFTTPIRMLTMLTLLAGCDGAVATDTDVDNYTPRCDGVKQEGEETVDAPFDLDGDGFFDQDNPDCAATFQPNQLDCDDSNPDVNPSKLEIPCNGVDDDCREASPESPDSDNDGVGACEDCDDQNPQRAPGFVEECFDGIDNDCDTITDNGCGEDYNGDWVIAEPPTLSCGIPGLPPLLPYTPLIEMNLAEVFVLWEPPLLTVGPTAGATPPLLETTEVAEDGTIAITNQEGTAPDCVKIWTLEGQFTDADHFEGTLGLDMNAPVPTICGACPLMPQSWPISATKQ